MTRPIKDTGMIQLFLMRLNEHRLPEATRLWEQVNKGECLSDYEMRFMKTVLEDAGNVRQLAAKYPEYQGLVDKVSTLYAQITRKALENQRIVAGRLA